ncbi:hypothetical protein AB3X91_27845 [Paraburkholderia sp. BR14263]|uniref:hypothetical protein n=1 Tax=unclassified Paraburkholderia TaxID=2615204 RepID=UPI0034CD799C
MLDGIDIEATKVHPTCYYQRVTRNANQHRWSNSEMPPPPSVDELQALRVEFVAMKSELRVVTVERDFFERRTVFSFGAVLF